MSLNRDVISKILVDSFYDNQSIDFVINNNGKKNKKLKLLMDYSIFMGMEFGKVYLTENKKACAIVIDSKKKKITLKSILWDFKLAFKVIGILNIKKVLARERLLKKHHPKTPFIHLWYIGVKPKNQGDGLGSKLLQQIINDYPKKDIYLETSTERNFPFYKKNGFRFINNLISEVGYHFHIYVHESKK